MVRLIAVFLLLARAAGMLQDVQDNLHMLQSQTILKLAPCEGADCGIGNSQASMAQIGSHKVHQDLKTDLTWTALPNEFIDPWCSQSSYDEKLTDLNRAESADECQQKVETFANSDNTINYGVWRFDQTTDGVTAPCYACQLHAGRFNTDYYTLANAISFTKPSYCNGFCATSGAAWVSKCDWQGCSACDDCTCTELHCPRCESYCSTLTAAWADKCGWSSGDCRGCSACSSLISVGTFTLKSASVSQYLSGGTTSGLADSIGSTEQWSMLMDSTTAEYYFLNVGSQLYLHADGSVGDTEDRFSSALVSSRSNAVFTLTSSLGMLSVESASVVIGGTDATLAANQWEFHELLGTEIADPDPTPVPTPTPTLPPVAAPTLPPTTLEPTPYPTSDPTTPPTPSPPTTVYSDWSAAGDDKTASVSCDPSMYIETCSVSSESSNSGDGLQLSTDGSTCTVVSSGQAMKAELTCGVNPTYTTVSSSIFLDNQYVSATCPGSVATGCTCYSAWKVAGVCNGQASFAPDSDGVCGMDIPSSGGRRRNVDSGAGAKIYAMCSGFMTTGDESAASDDALSTTECPMGYYVQGCTSSPDNGGDGVYPSSDSASCYARSSGSQIIAQAYCDARETYAVVSSDIFLDAQTLTVSCNDGNVPVYCMCYTAWKVSSICGGESSFAPTADGVCTKAIPSSGGRRRQVDSGAGAKIWAICDPSVTLPPTDAPTPAPAVTVYSDWSVAGNDKTTFGSCSSGTYLQDCVISSDSSNEGDGLYLGANNGLASCWAVSKGQAVKSQLTCDVSPTYVSTSSSIFLDNQYVSASCSSGSALACTCHSPWKASSICNNQASFAPDTFGVCGMDIPTSGGRRRMVDSGAGAKIYAICPGSETSGSASAAQDDAQSTATCTDGQYVQSCVSDPVNAGDGVSVSEDSSACYATSSGSAITAKAVCGTTETYSTVSSGIFLDDQAVTAGCTDGSTPLFCTCYSAWKVSSICGGVSTFEPTGDTCTKDIPTSGGRRRFVDSGAGAKIYAICASTPFT